MPRRRRKASHLALWAALILFALTGCSSGQLAQDFSGWSAIEVQGTEHYTLDTHETLEPEAAQPTEDTNTSFGDPADLGDNVISGHAYDADGEPLQGVYIYIRVVPESYGALYQTTTDAYGAYSYSVPEGVYLILAEYNPNDEPGGGVYLEPIDSDGSVTVPPSSEVDFLLSS
jgi:hypothetical protein